MKNYHKVVIAIILLSSLLAIAIGCIYYKMEQEKLEKRYVTLIFKNVGYEYRIENWGTHSKDYLNEGNYTVKEGTTLEILIEGNDFYEASAFIVNNNTISKDRLWYESVNENLTIEAIITKTLLRKAFDLFEAHNISVIKIDDLRRSSGFSHSLTEWKMDSLEDFVNFCYENDIPAIFWKRGREFGRGLLRSKQDYFLYIEDNNVYYWRQDI